MPIQKYVVISLEYINPQDKKSANLCREVSVSD